MEAVAIILAAGYSSRMGSFKPLLPIGGRPAIHILIDSIRAAGISRVIVVTGFKAARIDESIRDYVTRGAGIACGAGAPDGADNTCGAGASETDNADIETVRNEDYDGGMFTSVKAGLGRALSRQGSGPALIFPVDTPLVAPGSVTRLLAASAAAPDSFAVACFEGRKGHPLLIPMRYAAEITEETGGRGLSTIVGRYDKAGLMIRVETGDEGTVLDMDTPQGYGELKKYYANHPKFLEMDFEII